MEAIVLFDGVCNFCNDTVNFIIRNDPQKEFMFAPLQSEAGEQLRAKYGVDADIDSVVLIEDDKAYTHSTAGLKIARRLGGVYSLVYALIVVPAAIRDLGYKIFAANRYRLFGRKEVCMIPTPELKERFLS
jgi:predicted DCC family thiol-disulfide oxidoreductase YuxK